MITIEELLNLIVYFTIIGMFILLVQNIYTSTNAYQKTVNTYNTGLEKQLLYNTYINAYYVKGNKPFLINGIILQGSSGRVKVNDVYISLLNVGGNDEPY